MTEVHDIISNCLQIIIVQVRKRKLNHSLDIQNKSQWEKKNGKYHYHNIVTI